MARIGAVGLSKARRFVKSITLRSTPCGVHSRDGLAHRPVPGPPAGWFPIAAIARRSNPSITTYTSTAKVQVQNSTIYEMCSRVKLLQEFIKAFIIGG